MKILLLILALVPSCGLLTGEPSAVQEQAQTQLWNSIELATPGATEGLGGVANPFRKAVASQNAVDAYLTWPATQSAALNLLGVRFAKGEIGSFVADSLRERIHQLSIAVESLR